MNCRHISVISLFPEMVNAVASGVTGRAIERGLLDLQLLDLREFATDRHRTVDDRPFGGGPGMVMTLEPLNAALKAARSGLSVPDPQSVNRVVKSQVVYLSPQGAKFDAPMLAELGKNDALILLAGRYEGIDERFLGQVDREVSIGDYVLSGGELAAMVIIDALTRQIPGALGHEESARQDSFGDSGLLDCPHYTRPAVHEGMEVPAVLLSGDHQAIAKWRRRQALSRTLERRPELLQRAKLDAADRQFLRELQEKNLAG